MLRALALAAPLVVLAACGPSDPPDGGPCTYRTDPATFVVTAIDSTVIEVSPATTVVEVRLELDLEGSPAWAPEAPDHVTLPDRPPGWVSAQGIAVGSRIEGSADVIETGTCTPFILDLPVLD